MDDPAMRMGALAAMLLLLLGGCAIERAGLGRLDGAPGTMDAAGADATGGDPDASVDGGGDVVDGGEEDTGLPGDDAGTDAGGDVDAGTDAGPPDCTDGTTRPCGTDVGLCTAGLEACTFGRWNGVCAGAAGPFPEICNGLDDDCDGVADEDETGLCATLPVSGVRCMRWGALYRCMYLACADDPCCGLSPSPCPFGTTCEHIDLRTDCPPGCVDCGNCHMCVQ